MSPYAAATILNAAQEIQRLVHDPGRHARLHLHGLWTKANLSHCLTTSLQRLCALIAVYVHLVCGITIAVYVH